MKTFFNQYQNNKGFTLVEMILTIVVLAMLTIVAIPRDDSLVPISLDAAARKTRADIRYAQNLATTTGEPHGFRVTGNSTYEIYNVTTGAVALSAYNTPFQEDLSTNFGNTNFANTNYFVEFDSMGKPTVGGGTTIQLIDSNSNSKQIEISATSGYIQML